MKKFNLATAAAGALAALAIGLAAPAVAAPSAVGGNDDHVTVDHSSYPMSGQTPYGTYQNDHKARSDAR